MMRCKYSVLFKLYEKNRKKVLFLFLCGIVVVCAYQQI